MKFREMLSRLDSQGSLTRVHEPVSTKREIAALLRKHEGRPVLFEHVRESDLPVAGNLLSSMELLCRSVGVAKEEWIANLNLAMGSPGPITMAAGEFEYVEPDLDRTCFGSLLVPLPRETDLPRREIGSRTSSTGFDEEGA